VLNFGGEENATALNPNPNQNQNAILFDTIRSRCTENPVFVLACLDWAKCHLSFRCYSWIYNGKPKSDATKNAISEAKTGTTCPEETKTAFLAAKTGTTCTTEGTKTAISAANTGKCTSDATKNAISASKSVKCDEAFDARISQLKKFKKTYGHCDVKILHGKSAGGLTM